MVVGAATAVQIAAELAGPARVAPASRAPVRFARSRILGRDLHFWLRRTGWTGQRSAASRASPRRT